MQYIDTSLSYLLTVYTALDHKTISSWQKSDLGWKNMNEAEAQQRM